MAVTDTRHNSTKRSIWFSLDEAEIRKEDSFRSSHYVYMFGEDCHLGIMPLRRLTENTKFAILIEPSSPQVENMISKGIAERGHHSHDLAEAVCDFVDNIAHTLGYHGKAFYEIVYFSSGDRKFRLELMPFHKVKKGFKKYWQYIPKKIIEKRHLNTRRIALDMESVVKFEIPKDLGGPKNHKNIVNKLAWLSDKSIQPLYSRKEMTSGIYTGIHDFEYYRKNAEIYVARLCKLYGWNGRGMFENSSLEYYQIFRYLKFARFKAMIREHIIDRLNFALKMIGRKLDFEAKLKVIGLLSSSDFDKELKKLQAGTLSFSEAVDKIWN